MKECLLCETRLTASLSWKSLLGMDKQALICTKCLGQFQRINIKENTGFGQVASLYSYNEAMRNYLHQFKFLQDVALAGVFANELRPYLPKEAMIVPIPMHPEKLAARTFAHVDEVLKYGDIPFVHLLEKTGTESMGEKSKKERLAMDPLFKLRQHSTINPNAFYILIDDIYTTGTTLRHAVTVLKEAGAKRIEAVTLIRAKRQL